MTGLASESARASAGSDLVGVFTLRELSARLDVALGWRPWPRMRLSARELRALKSALADVRCELVGRQTPPRSLWARVVVTQANAPTDGRVARAGRLAWNAGIKLTGFAVGLTAFAAAVIGIVSALDTNSSRPTPLGGNLSVIVLPFAAQGVERPAATALAHTVATTLRARLTQLDPLVLPAVRWIPGRAVSNIAEQGHYAATLAATENADAVMFGQVSSGELTSIAPYVYVSPRRLRQASELAGVYSLGSPIRLSVQIGESTAADGEAREQLATRAVGLAEFVDAIGYYAVGRYAQAATHLRAAAESPSWTTPQARAMIDLFLGNATGKLASTPAALGLAGRYYRAALAHNPTLERARFGLAEVGFQQAHGDCTTRTVKRQLMGDALASYRAILAARSPPPGSTPGIELRTKARFGIARIYLCLSQAGLTSQWPQVERTLREVIAAYSRARFLRSEAGEAWGDLALAQLPDRGAPATRSAYRAALRSYTRAIELTLDPTARAALYANRAFVEQRLGERSAAANDHTKAAQAASNATSESRLPAGAASTTSP